jgi:hypothetical protein
MNIKLLLCLLAILAVSCGGVGTLDDSDSRKSENNTIPGYEKPELNPYAPPGCQPLNKAVLEDEWAKWKALDLPDYCFTRTFNSNPPIPETIVLIQAGREPQVLPARDGAVDFNLWDSAAIMGNTIDEIYATILKEFVPRVGNETEYPHWFTIRYNAEYHYPEYFSSEVVELPQHGNILDGGYFGITITNFEVYEKPELNPYAPPGCQPFDKAELEDEWAKWKALALPAYRFTRTFNSNPPRPKTIVTIQAGKEPEVVPARGVELDLAQGDGTAIMGNTIDEIYAAILRAYVSRIGDETNYPYLFTIRYNAEYHYPEYFSEVIHFTPPFMVLGGYIGIEITHFEVLEVEE